jgi:hypothetical protein
MQFRDRCPIGLDDSLQARITWLILMDSMAIFRGTQAVE